MSESLEDYLRAWNKKPVVRTIYEDFYARIARACGPGTTIEIGGGIGNLQQSMTDVITTDVQFAPWVDCVADAQRLPFKSGSIGNIVMVDVLHHLEYPATFFAEAERVLRPMGRIVMVEPAITWGSSLFYRLFHQEPVRTSVDPLGEGSPDPQRDPYQSNQAIPTLIATRARARFQERFPNLSIQRVDWFSIIAYPLSGGFKPWSLLSLGMARRLLALERKVEALIGPFAAFRMMLVIEKVGPADI
jgi:SAM-dependent methyltransferase